MSRSKMFDSFRPTAQLPVTEAMVAECIGRAAAIRLSWRLFHLNPAVHGSVHGYIYVPRIPKREFYDLVGDDDVANELAANFHGEPLFFTGCRQLFKEVRDHGIRYLCAQGIPKSVVARIALISDRQVRNICRDIVPWRRTEVSQFIPEANTLNMIGFMLAQRPPCRT